MNERILELKRQAVEEAAELCNIDISVGHIEEFIYPVSEEDQKKINYNFFLLKTDRIFAEKIVGECIECTKEWYEARIADSARDYSRGYVHGCDEAIAEMKKRFGVEE